MQTGTALLIVTMGLAGCGGSMGRKIDDAKVKNIQECVTTEKDLLAWFGEPYQRGNQNGMPTMQWMYAAAGLGSQETQSLIVVLNKNGKVVHYALNPTAFPESKDTCS